MLREWLCDRGWHRANTVTLINTDRPGMRNVPRFGLLKEETCSCGAYRTIFVWHNGHTTRLDWR